MYFILFNDFFAKLVYSCNYLKLNPKCQIEKIEMLLACNMLLFASEIAENTPTEFIAKGGEPHDNTISRPVIRYIQLDENPE
jgi:hypothetical protein